MKAHLTRTWHWWALAALVLVFFADPLLTGRTFFYRDLGMLMHPVLQAARDDGSLVPFWTHLLSNGRPLLANPGYALLAPLNIVYVLFPFNAAFNLFLVAHVLIGATGMTFLARRLGCSRAAAFTAGAAYALGGGMISAIALYWTAVASGWAPWVLAAGHAACERPSLRRIALLALALGLQALGGQPEPILATLLVGALLSLAVAVGSPVRRAGVVAATWGIAGIWGIAIAAPQLVPAAIHARTTIRALGFTAHGILYNSLDPRALPGFFLARWGGNPMERLSGGFPGAAWTDSGTPYVLSHYVGLSVLVLAVVGAWHLARSRRMPGLALALSGAATVGVILALGRHVPGATALIEALPFPVPLRYPVKALSATFLAVPPLAAFGIEAILSSRLARWAPLLAAVVAMDVSLAHRGFAPTASRDAFEEPPLSRTLKTRARELGIPDGQWRIHHQRLEGGSWDIDSGELEATAEAHYAWRRRMLMPPTGAPFKIHHAMEPTGDLLDDLEYFKFTKRAYEDRAPEPEGDLPADLQILEPSAPGPSAPRPQLAEALGEAGVLFVISPDPELERLYVFLVHERSLGPEDGVPSGSGHVYRNVAFQPRAGFQRLRPPETGDPGGERSPGRITRLAESPSGLLVETTLDEESRLMLSDAPGDRAAWTAIVNGTPVDPGRWGPFVAPVVPAGDSVVSLRYRPRGLTAGCIACLVGVAGVLASFVPRRRRISPS